jgi:hypothetical protein
MGVSLSELVRNSRRTHTRQFMLPAEESDPARRSMQALTAPHSWRASFTSGGFSGMQSIDLPHVMDTTIHQLICVLGI